MIIPITIKGERRQHQDKCSGAVAYVPSGQKKARKDNGKIDEYKGI